MNADLEIRRVILYYPGVMKSRLDALGHIFTPTHNGYAWVEGELVDRMADPDPSSYDPHRFDTVESYAQHFVRSFPHDEFGDDDYMQLIASQRISLESYHMQRIVAQDIDRRMWDARRYDYAVPEDVPEERVYYWSPLRKSSILFLTPWNARPSWLSAAMETAKLIINADYHSTSGTTVRAVEDNRRLCQQWLSEYTAKYRNAVYLAECYRFGVIHSWTLKAACNKTVEQQDNILDGMKWNVLNKHLPSCAAWLEGFAVGMYNSTTIPEEKETEV